MATAVVNMPVPALIRPPTPEKPATPVDDVALMGESWVTLRDMCVNHERFFDELSNNGQRIREACRAIRIHQEALAQYTPILKTVAAQFDFSPEVPGNGYWSFLYVIDCAVKHCAELTTRIKTKRSSKLFKKAHHAREIESWSQVMASLVTMTGHMQTLVGWSDPGNLYPHEYHSPEELLLNMESVNLYAFYGRCASFQYAPSMRKALTLISVALASYSEGYYSNAKTAVGRTAYSLLASSKYYRNPELRARRIVDITQRADIDFCKAFWHLADTDFMTQLPAVVCPNVVVNVVFTIPTEPLRLPRCTPSDPLDGNFVDIPIPTSHFGAAPIQVRLVSSKRRVGMAGGALKKGGKVHPPSPNLVLHCHGGGFVSCTSASHEVYLRQWSRDLDVPILSVDYSLAPEAPFPRALEEVFYVYCWALKNPQFFGWTGEKIVVVGDSAGGNLVTAATLRCLDLGVRPPTGVCGIYTPFLVQFTPSPSRMLCLMDPLIPFGVMLRCLQSYAGHLLGSPLYSQLDADNKLPLPEPLPEKEARELIKRSTSIKVSGERRRFPKLRRIRSQPDGDKRGMEKDVVETFKEKYVRRRHSQPLDPRLEAHLREDEHDDSDLEFANGAADEAGGMKPSTFLGMIGSSFKRWRRSTSMWSSSSEPTTPPILDDTPPRSPVLAFTKFRVPRDPLLSPYVASDELLAQFPPLSVVTTPLDPCLDDCVMFAKRANTLGVDTSLRIIPGGLPHGFLNFAVASEDAKEGMHVCIDELHKLFNQHSIEALEE